MGFLSTNSIFGGHLFLLVMVSCWLSHLGLRHSDSTRRVSKPCNSYFIDPPCISCHGNIFVPRTGFITRTMLLMMAWWMLFLKKFLIRLEFVGPSLGGNTRSGIQTPLFGITSLDLVTASFHHTFLWFRFWTRGGFFNLLLISSIKYLLPLALQVLSQNFPTLLGVFFSKACLWVLGLFT